MRFFRPLAAVALVALAAGLHACDSAAPFRPDAPTEAALQQSPTADLGTTIRSMIAAGFPKGTATAVGARWDQVLRNDARAPKTTLKGKLVPNSDARAELARTVEFLALKTAEATPPAGETKDHFVARLALNMSTYLYRGPTAAPPALSLTSDIAVEVVQPTETDTVVTPAKQAALVVPAGAVSEPTVVVVTPVQTYYPQNCSGPLDTKLCQYPLFYHFEVFPDVKLNTPAKVQVCHVHSGTNRLPLADHDRFRVAHEKPSNPADYSAGSTIVDNVEVLALAQMGVTDCHDDGGTNYPPPVASVEHGFLGRFASRAAWTASRVAAGIGAMLTPKSAHAIDVGVGGFIEEFSIFGIVDPHSKADVAQSPAPPGRFSLGATTAPVGGSFPVHAWTVTNLGSGTSGAFASAVILATDSLLTSALTTVPVGGGAAIVPQATHAYGGFTFQLPASVGPGTYYVGTRVTPSGADSAASNDLVSVRVTVTSPNLAQSTQPGSSFSVTPTTVVQGGVVQTGPWAVVNTGNGASGAFASVVRLASDSAMTQVVSTLAVGGPTALAAGASYTYQATSLAIPVNLAPGAYFVGTIADTGNTSGDLTPANNRVSVKITVVGIPNLAQATGAQTRFRLDTTTVQPGGTVVAQPWQVVNVGTAASTAFVSVIRLATDSLLTQVVGNVSLAVGGASSLAAGAAHGYPATSVTIPAGTSPGVYFVGTIADTGNTSGDATPADNRVSTRITVMGYPNLAVGTFSISPASGAPGSTITVSSWTVTNVGNAASGPFNSAVRIATDAALANVVTEAVVATPSIPVGGSHTYPAMTIVVPTTAAAGSYWVGTVADPANSTGDPVLANNQAAAPFTVAVGPADLAVTDFSLQQTSVPQGGSVAHSAWSVKNVGGATSGVFTREMILASDSLFVNPVARVAVTGTAVAPGGIVSVGASSFPVSKCQAPGQYFLGPLVYTSPADTNPANNQTSRAIVVTQGAPYAAQGPSSSPWGSMATHGGAFTHQLYPECAVLTYDNSGHLGGTYNNPVETFDFWTTAVATGPVTFKWTYQACHSWYQAQAGLRAWVSNGQGRVYTTLLPFGNYGCPFGSSGTVTLNLTAGQQWGVEAKGDHYDSSKVLNGTITLSVP